MEALATRNRERTSIVDMLVAIIIGIIGMFLSLLGLEVDSPLTFGLGIGIMLVAFIFGILKCLNEFWDFKDRLKKKDR